MAECLSCGNTIENPRVERGRVKQKFCNQTCKNKYHTWSENKVKGLMGEIRKLLEDTDCWGRVSIVFTQIMEENHLD